MIRNDTHGVAKLPKCVVLTFRSINVGFITAFTRVYHVYSLYGPYMHVECCWNNVYMRINLVRTPREIIHHLPQFWYILYVALDKHDVIDEISL